MKEWDFTGSVVVVTGAGQGLGAAFAKAFASYGARVALIGRTLAKVEAVAASIAADGGSALAGGNALAVGCDISDPADVQRAFAAITDAFGSVDVLVNNAAFHQSVSVVDTTFELWDKQIQTNLGGTFLCTKAVLPGMIECRRGKIVNISSSAAKHFFPGFGAYAASKGGMVSFTHTLSEEVKQHNINVNAIYLGMTDTEHTRERMAADKAVTIPLDAMLSVDDVVPVVLFLASEDSRAIMGAAIDVFGKKS